jgi:hypothetical protein
MKNKYFTTILLFLFSTFGFSLDVNAQGIPVLTDPIKVRELELMSNKLDLTSPQREAILDVYDRYLVNFNDVLEGEIADLENGLTDAVKTLGFMRFSIPERDMVEGLMKLTKRAMAAIHRSDTIFLDELAGMLTQKQSAELARQRIERELKAYNIFTTQLLGELNRGARSNLRNMYGQLNVDSTQEVEEILDKYNQRYLSEVKQSFNSIFETIESILDQIDELGIREMDQQTMMMHFMGDEAALDDLKSRGDVLLQPLVKQAYDISQLNWSTWRKLDAILDEENARKLQGYYFKRSFRDAVRGGSKIEGYLDKALSLKELADWQKQELLDAQEDFRSKWKKRSRSYADILEKSRKVLNIAIMSGEIATEFDEKLDKREEDTKQFVDATESKINGILGIDLVAKLKDSKNNQGTIELTSGTTVIVNNDGTSAGVQVTEENKDVNNQTVIVDEVKLYGGAEIPKPIAPSFPERASSVLELDENGTMIISAVYDEYREQYEVANENISSQSKAINDDKELSQGARLRSIGTASKEAAESVAVLDTIFFDDLAAITGLERFDINLKMLENHRERQRTAAPDDPFGWRGGEGDTIDLVGLYVMSNKSDELQNGLEEESIKAVLNAMQGYHDNIHVAHNNYVKAMYNLNHLQDAMWLMEDSEQNQRVAEKMQNRWRDAFLDVSTSKKALLLANQNVMESLLSSVSETDYWRVRTEFVKKAYPDILKKDADLTTMLTAAIAIPSIDKTQASQLKELATSYRSDYWNLCEAMIKNHQENATSKSDGEFLNKEDMHRQLRLERLRFQRKELNDRIRMRLRMVLNEDQIKDVPGLRPSVAAVNEWN